MISGKRYFVQCIEISREQGLGKTLAANLMMRGYMSHWQNEVALALRDIEEAVSLAQETGQMRAEMIALSAGEFLAEQGSLDKGERWASRQLALSRRLGSRVFMGEGLVTLGRLAHLRGCWDEAEKLAEEAVDTLRDGGMAYLGPRHSVYWRWSQEIQTGAAQRCPKPKNCSAATALATIT